MTIENLLDCGGPRRQAGQVGDNSKTKRAESDAWSKALSNWLKFSVERIKSGFWAGGVFEGPQRYHAAESNSAASAAKTTPSFFIFMARRTCSLGIPQSVAKTESYPRRPQARSKSALTPLSCPSLRIAWRGAAARIRCPAARL